MGIDEINTNLDTTPLPPNNLVAQDPQSKELAGYVRTKTFGRDVRESIARSIELNSTRSKSAEILANETVNVANDLTDRFNQQIGALTEDSEVIDARGGKVNLRTRLDDTDAQLAHIVVDHSISPDYFEGSDKEKIEQAITRVLAQGGGNIRLPRMYDLTGETPIMLDKINSGDRRVVIFLGDGGGFKKEDGGYMFSSTVNDSGDWFFNNVQFHSVSGVGTTIFDGGKLIRIQWNGCHARNVDTLVDAPNNYIQTYSFNGGSVIGGQGSAIKVPSAYDLVCGGHFYVEHRENFFEQIKETTNQFKGLYNVKFTDMMVEGLSGYAFKITRAEALKLSGVYFEVNKGGHILMNEADYLDAVKIESCRFHENASTELESAIVWGHYLKGCSTSNNFARNIALHDTSFIHEASIYKVTSYEDVALNNSREDIPNIDIRGKIIIREDNYKLTTKDGIYESSLRGYTSSTDYNSLTKSGVYHMSGSAPNAPMDMWAICEVYNTGGYILQRANTRPDGSIYTRFRESGTWTAWRRNLSEAIV